MNSENMRRIPGYPDYFATSDGKIVSMRRAQTCVMNPDVTRLGYLRVGISNENGRKRFLVHRLVAMAWIERPDFGTEINHIDGVKSNNRPENLEWSTRSKNVKHAFKIGVLKPLRGERNPLSKLTEQQAREIKNRLKNYSPGMLAELSKEFGVCKEAIGLIKNGKNWAYL